MNPAMGKIVSQLELFNLGMATSLGKLNTNLLNSAKNYPALHPARLKGLVNDFNQSLQTISLLTNTDFLI